MGAKKYFGGGSTAGKDMRGTPRSAIQMLFGGGKTAAEDLRGAGPRGGRMLFGGGRTAGEDLRMDHDGEDGLEPHNLRMLAEGGDAEGIPEELHIAGEDVMAAFKSGNPADLTKALYSFFMLCESAPHDEGPPEGEGEQEEGPPMHYRGGPANPKG